MATGPERPSAPAPAPGPEPAPEHGHHRHHTPDDSPHLVDLIPVADPDQPATVADTVGRVPLSLLDFLS